MNTEDNWDYEAEARMAFDIMTAEARAIERRGFDSEAEYQRQVGRIDRLLSQVLIYRALKRELETLVPLAVPSDEEDLTIRAAQYWLEAPSQANYDALRFLTTPQPERRTPLGEMEEDDIVPYLRELDRAVAEAARFLLEDALEAEAEENEPGEDVT